MRQGSSNPCIGWVPTSCHQALFGLNHEIVPPLGCDVSPAAYGGNISVTWHSSGTSHLHREPQSIWHSNNVACAGDGCFSRGNRLNEPHALGARYVWGGSKERRSKGRKEKCDFEQSSTGEMTLEVLVAPRMGASMLLLALSMGSA